MIGCTISWDYTEAPLPISVISWKNPKQYFLRLQICEVVKSNTKLEINGNTLWGNNLGYKIDTETVSSSQISV